MRSFALALWLFAFECMGRRIEEPIHSSQSLKAIRAHAAISSNSVSTAHLSQSHSREKFSALEAFTLMLLGLSSPASGCKAGGQKFNENVISNMQSEQKASPDDNFDITAWRKMNRRAVLAAGAAALPTTARRAAAEETAISPDTPAAISLEAPAVISPPPDTPAAISLEAPAVISPPSPAPAPPPVPTEISYQALTQRLNDCRSSGICTVARVEFTNASGETAFVILESGVRLPIVGIPTDDPSSDSSPLKLAAKLRDAKVPYTFPFSQYLKSQKSVPEKPVPFSFPFPFSQ